MQAERLRDDLSVVEGEPLSEIIKREAPLDPRRAANITRQIAMALSTAHKHQLIHRDVKPHNVIISAGDVAKISDFGIAQKIVPEEADTGVKKQTVMGSIHYFSPEQARGAYVDERSDIYSLGIVLYEMLTGKVPFDGETPVDVALKHMNQPMIPPSKLNPDIPQDLEDIVMKATAKLQKDRYGSADEMITDLSFVKFSRQAGSGKKNETEEKSPEETPEERKARLRAERQAEKRRKLIKAGIIAAVVLALMLTGIGIVNHILNKGKQENKIIDTPYVVGQSFDEAKQYLKQFLLELEVDMQVSSNEPAGTILSQSPREDTTIKQGQTIKVTISLGPSTAAVPMLVGETEKNAKAMLESYGYKVGETTGGYSDEYAKGYVMAQDPSAGTPLDKGQTVNIVVSLGPESGPPEIRTVTVPKLTQKTLAEAQRAIDDAGLSIGTITEQESSSVAEGCVISQSIGAGSKVDAGTEINIIVSLGAPKKDNSAENTAPGGTGD